MQFLKPRFMKLRHNGRFLFKTWLKPMYVAILLVCFPLFVLWVNDVFALHGQHADHKFEQEIPMVIPTGQLKYIDISNDDTLISPIVLLPQFQAKYTYLFSGSVINLFSLVLRAKLSPIYCGGSALCSSHAINWYNDDANTSFVASVSKGKLRSVS